MNRGCRGWERGACGWRACHTRLHGVKARFPPTGRSLVLPRTAVCSSTTCAGTPALFRPDTPSRTQHPLPAPLRVPQGPLPLATKLPRKAHLHFLGVFLGPDVPAASSHDPPLLHTHRGCPRPTGTSQSTLSAPVPLPSPAHPWHRLPLSPGDRSLVSPAPLPLYPNVQSLCPVPPPPSLSMSCLFSTSRGP